MAKGKRLEWASDRLYNLLAEYCEVIENMPESVRPPLFEIAEKFLKEVAALSDLERVTPVTPRKQ